jgi:pyruvate formate lyase activating enzyme
MPPYFRILDERIECRLCPHFCRIAEGRTGICGVRINNGKEIGLITYGVISGYALDPVEKKPLYHFFPGHTILSIGSFGCNMRCDFCQNYHISQSVPESARKGISPEELVISALDAENNIGIAFTYNEPMVWYEYIRDVSLAVRNAGMKTVIVSNGYVNSEPLADIISFTDAFNIDLKAFSNSSYKILTGAGIEPVMNSLKQISASGKHLEITSLIIPGHNDSERDMGLQTEWIAKELGRNVPLHLSRYYPTYRRDDPATSLQTLEKLYRIASSVLDHVYLGNTRTGDGQDTKCPGCRQTVTVRSGYNTRIMNLDKDGNCTSCGRQVYRNFTFSLKKGN